MIPGFELPAWLPWWVPTILLVLGLLWLLAFLLVPFSVIGVKARLDGLEARLDEIQAEIRTLALRLPEAVHTVDFDELYTPPPPEPLREQTPDPARRVAPSLSRPPIPPAPHELHDEVPPEAIAAITRKPSDRGRGDPMREEAPEEPRTASRRAEPNRTVAGRAEPRLKWRPD